MKELLLALAVSSGAAQPALAALQPGDAAPRFSAQASLAGGLDPVDNVASALRAVEQLAAERGVLSKKP